MSSGRRHWTCRCLCRHWILCPTEGSRETGWGVCSPALLGFVQRGPAANSSGCSDLSPAVGLTCTQILWESKEWPSKQPKIWGLEPGGCGSGGLSLTGLIHTVANDSLIQGSGRGHATSLERMGLSPTYVFCVSYFWASWNVTILSWDLPRPQP